MPAGSASAREIRSASNGIRPRPTHRPLIDEFVDAVRMNREPAVTGDIGRAVSAIEDQIYAVAPSGR